MNDVPVARQSRDPARTQAGESLLDAKHECSPAKPKCGKVGNATRPGSHCGSLRAACGGCSLAWRLRAHTQAGESLLEQGGEPRSSLQLDFPVLLLKFGYPFLYHLFKLTILCSALIFCDISEFIQKFLLNAQRISAQIILHFAASVTKY